MVHSQQMASNEELLGHVVDGQGDRPDGTMWMVAIPPYGNVVAMDEVSQSKLLFFFLSLFFLISVPSIDLRKADSWCGPGGQALALHQRG